MRKFGIKFSRHHPDPEAAESAFIDCRTIEDWWEVLDRLYGSQEVERQAVPPPA